MLDGHSGGVQETVEVDVLVERHRDTSTHGSEDTPFKLDDDEGKQADPSLRSRCHSSAPSALKYRRSLILARRFSGPRDAPLTHPSAVTRSNRSVRRYTRLGPCSGQCQRRLHETLPLHQIEYRRPIEALLWRIGTSFIIRVFCVPAAPEHLGEPQTYVNVHRVQDDRASISS